MHDMQLYQWHGIRANGEQASGMIQADSLNTAKRNLRQQQIVLHEMIKCKTTIKSSEITRFTRQLATLLKAGIPLSSAFTLLENSAGQCGLRLLYPVIRKDIEAGNMLSQSLSIHKKQFDTLYCNLIAIGEQSGTLDLMLEKLASYRENHDRIRKKFKKILTWPLLVTLFAIVTTTFMLIFVIPRFEALYQGFHAELPLLTRAVIQFSSGLQQWGLAACLTLLAGSITLWHITKRSTRTALLFSRISLSMPLIGQVYRKTVIARFAQTLAITHASGIPLRDALKSIAGITGNRIFSRAVFQIHEAVSRGHSLHRAIRNTGLFPDMVTQLISTGEESGSLENMLEKISLYYENEVDSAMDTLASLLEPLIMTLLGLITGILIIAMYMPIINLGSII